MEPGPNSGYAGQVSSELAKSQDMQKIKEYNNFYLYGKFHNGRLLYKECFRKSDIDGVKKQYVERDMYNSASRRGW